MLCQRLPDAAPTRPWCLFSILINRVTLRRLMENFILILMMQDFSFGLQMPKLWTNMATWISKGMLTWILLLRL